VINAIKRYVALLILPFMVSCVVKKVKSNTNDNCVCTELPDLAVVMMGAGPSYRLYEKVSETLEKVRSRGEPYEWVSAERCRRCGQWWLVGTEQGHIDVLCLRRLNPETVNRLLSDDIWPSDFDKYATLLRLGKAAGRVGGWIDGMDPALSSIPWTMAYLARETPGIRVSELAELLNLDVSIAAQFAERVVREKGLIITFDKGQNGSR
jgi:hypothetical protein